jgi:hypothetical protein
MVVLERLCKLCGKSFELQYCHGRPRSYCLTCQPVGWKVVQLRHRVKLRRDPPLWTRSELELILEKGRRGNE